MNTWKTANSVGLVDGRSFIVDAPLEGDVRRALATEPRVRDDVGGWAW